MPCHGQGCDNCSSNIGPALKPSLCELVSVTRGLRQIFIINHQARGVATLPKGAGAAVAAVEATYIKATQRLHHQHDRLGVLVALQKRRRSEEHTSELQSRENLVCR